MRSASLSPELPPIEFDAVREPAPGGVESSDRFAEQRGRFRWIAIGVSVALLAAIVNGGHDHATEETGAASDTQTDPIVVPIDGPGAITTIRITNIEVGSSTHHTYFAVTGTGDAPGRRYDLQVGRCPSTAAIFSVGARARVNGTFAGSLETPGFPGDAVLWLRVVDENGLDEGGVEGQLANGLFSPFSGGEPPCQGGAGRSAVTILDRPAHFTDRRATLSPPTDIGVDPLPPAQVLAAIEPMGIGAPELILGRYEDAETGLTLDPAWIVIDRGVVTSELESDGVTHTFDSTNTVRIVNAVTGRVVLTFPAPGKPVIMAE